MQLPTDKQLRKEMPIATGFLGYFPLAAGAVARVSYIGNQQHNPGQPMHWAREKSKDHTDCVARHLTDVLMDPDGMDTDGLYHDQKLAWRALAVCQLAEERRAKQRAKLDLDDGCISVGGLAVECGLYKAPVASNPSDSEVATERISPRETIEQLDYEYEEAKRIQDEARLEAAKIDPRKPTVYISGPMRGHPEFNFPAFDKARDMFIAEGYNVISPADVDRNDPNPPAPGETHPAHVYADRDYAALRRSTHIALLPGWEHSTGAAAEVFLARWLGLIVLDAETGKPLTHFNAMGLETAARRYLGVK